MKSKENPDIRSGRTVTHDRPHLSDTACRCLGVLIRLSKQAESKVTLTADVSDHPLSFPLGTVFDECLIGNPESVVRALDDLERYNFVQSWSPNPDDDKCYCLSPISKKRAGVKTRALVLRDVEYEDGKSWSNRDRLSVKRPGKSEPKNSGDRFPARLLGLDGPWKACEKVCPYHGKHMPKNTVCIRCNKASWDR